MTYKCRKKIVLCFFVMVSVFLKICGGSDSDYFKNSTSFIPIEDDSNKSLISEILATQQNGETTKSGNITMNSTVYSVETQEYDYEDFDVPMMDCEYLKNLNFPHSLKAVQEAMKKISNPQCINDTTTVLKSISKRERWAVELLDSFPKFPESILYGNYYQLGNFDECVGVKHSNQLGNTINGQYCLADIHIKRKFENKVKSKRLMENMASKKNRWIFDNDLIHWAICLPSSCGAKDAEIFIKEILFSSVQSFEVISIDTDDKKCEPGRILKITTTEIIYGSIVGIFLIFIIMATVVHFWHLKMIRKSAMYNVDDLRQKQSSVLKEILICFSVINTTEKFFHTSPNDLNLESICGVKFISMVMIIAGHSLIFFFGGPIANANFFPEVSTKVEHAIFMNSPIIVDTFLLISGFLMCRLLLIELDKRKGKVNFLVLYIARYIRLTPAYAIVVGLYSTFLYRMGSGPFWESRIGMEKERCEKSWWLNLLYVNNYVGTDHLCMFQSWYLAVDYHLFIVAPFIIYPLWKKPKLGEILLLVCTILSIAAPFWITYKEKLDPTVMAYPPEVKDLAKNFYFINYYVKTHMRVSSYCIGLFYAYLVHKIQGSVTKLPTYIIILGWIFALVCGVASMFSIIIFYDSEHNVNFIENALYASLHRITWSLAVGWIIIMCITDNAGFINKFLSHKFFIPASRLTYCAYLANGLVEIYSAGVARQPMNMNIFELVYKTLGHIVLTFAIAFVLCIFFESPIHAMEKIVLKNYDGKNNKARKSVISVNEL